MSTQPMNQIDTMFDLHRSFVAQQLDFTRDALSAQQELLAAAGEGIELWRTVADQQAAMSRSASAQAFENLPEDLEGSAEFAAFVEQTIAQVESANETGIDTAEAAFEESTDAYGRFVEAYLDALESGIDAYIEATESIEEATETVATEIDIE